MRANENPEDGPPTKGGLHLQREVATGPATAGRTSSATSSSELQSYSATGTTQVQSSSICEQPNYHEALRSSPFPVSQQPFVNVLNPITTNSGDSLEISEGKYADPNRDAHTEVAMLFDGQLPTGPTAVRQRKCAPDDRDRKPPINLMTRASAAVHRIVEQRANMHHSLFRDRVFSEEDWSSHMSFLRFLPEPFHLLKVLYELVLPLSAVLLIAIACGVYEDVIKPDGGPSLDDLKVEFAYSLSGFALSLLLVFKTNTSFARFWEARSAWASVYTHCKLFICKAQSYAPDAPLVVRQLFVRWTVALPYLLRSHLMSYKPGSDSLQFLLLPEEISWLRSGRSDSEAAHQPMLAANLLMNSMKALGVSDVNRYSTTTHLDNFIAAVDILWKIQSTPVPMPYSRHTTRFVVIYVCGLPLALWQHLRWGTVAIAPPIALLLVGIEHIGVMIENPMRVLPMAAYCERIQDNVLSVGSHWCGSGGQQQGGDHLVKQVLQLKPPAWQQAEPTDAGNLPTPRCGGYVEDPKSDAPTTYRISHRLSNESESNYGTRGTVMPVARIDII